MTCRTYQGGVTVCSPPQGIVRRHYLHCWNCKTKRRCVEVFGGIWYPSTFYCVFCGDGWGDGETLARPFARGWRQKAIARAKRYWREALSPEAYKAALKAAMRAEFPEEAAS